MSRCYGVMVSGETEADESTLARRQVSPWFRLCRCSGTVTVAGEPKRPGLALSTSLWVVLLR